MKRTFLAFSAVSLLAMAAHAFPSCESYMQYGCSAYTGGLTEVLQIDAMQYEEDPVNLPGKWSLNLSEPQFTSLGMDEFVPIGPGSEYVAVDRLSILLINAAKDLDTKKLDKQSGTSGQYIGGDNALHTLPSTSATFNYPTRALNTCFQISSTKDARFGYGVDVNAPLALGSGTATITSYTNSGCTTGAQVLRDSTVGGLGVGATTSIQLDGTLQANRWAKITTASTGLGVTLSIRAAQAEVIQ